MIKVNGYEQYFGGKSGNGTYQTLINFIPPLDVWAVGCLGGCGVTKYMRPGNLNLLNDLDADVVAAWQTALDDVPGYIFTTLPVVKWLADIANMCDTGAKMFVFLDPPYLMETRKSQRKVYKYEMSKSGHVALLETVTAMPKGVKIMITHYPNELYDLYLNGWNTHDFYSTIRGGVALERIYYNYSLNGELHDYTYIGDDFREREKNNRIKQNFIKKLKRLPVNLRNSILIDLLALKSDQDLHAEKCDDSSSIISMYHIE